MDLRVGRILELLRQEVRLRVGRNQFLGLGDGTAHTFRPWGQDQFRTIGAQQLATLATHRLRHGNHQLVTTRRTYHGQPDTSITRCRLHNNRLRPDLAGLLRRINHRYGDTVLDAVPRIEELQLGNHRRPHTLGDPIEAHQRSIADQLRYRICDVHFIPPVHILWR
ncbi:hypothetical protein D3C72_1649290 [compost metagenome]